MHYLDHNATSPLRPEARAAMDRALSAGGNPSSVHRSGRTARAMVETAREQVAQLVGAEAGTLIFTSGGTEANMTALSGAVQAGLESGERITRLFVSAIEHESILANAATLAERSAGLRLSHISVTRDGTVDLETLRVQLREGKGRSLIAVMAANNETGVVQPIPAIAELARDANALLLVDAVQAIGKIALDVSCADYLTMSAHKLGGPLGVGALIVKDGAPFVPAILGGGQERGMRAGTENVAGIAGFGAAAAAARGVSSVLRNRFEDGLRMLDRHVAIFGASAQRLPNTSNFAFAGISAENALMALDLDGVMVSSGSACSSGKVKSSHVLKAMDVPQELARCALRVSFGWNSTEDDVDAALASLSQLIARAQTRVAA